MLKQLVFLMLCVLNFGSLEVHSQIKVTSETKVFPRNFNGVDPAILSNNLYGLLQQNQATGKSIQSIQNRLKNRKVYGDLTTNDLFAFVPKSSKYVSGSKKGDVLTTFSGNLYRFMHLDDFPEPRLVTVKGCGQGSGTGGSKDISSKTDLVTEYDSGVSFQSIWKQGLIHLKTTIDEDTNKQVYKGVKGISCNESEFFIPSTQFHFELGFVKPQPFRLLNVSDNVFWFDSYKYQQVSGAGIIAWNPESKWEYGKKTETEVPVFIAKLVPPYLKRESLTKKDIVEGKNHTAIRNIIYIELVAIWLVSQETGEVISKDAHEAKPLIANSSQKTAYKTSVKLPSVNESASELVSQSSPLSIVSKPKPRYSEIAKQKKISAKLLVKIEFLFNGKIGEISPTSELPSDILEAVIKAARGIQFIPAKKNGVSYTVTKTIMYTFP